MGQLVLLVVAAAWAAVLVPPLLRSRIENRPNSSVSDFRNQLSSLQRAMPSRGVAMRSMARPLAPSPLSRPAAAGRPRRPRPQPHPRRRSRPASAATSPSIAAAAPSRCAPTTPRPGSRSHAERRPPAPVERPATPSSGAGPTCCSCSPSSPPARCSSPPPPRSQPMIWVVASPVVALVGYVCLLGQLRQRELEPAPAPPLRPAPPVAAPEARRRPAAAPGARRSAARSPAARSPVRRRRPTAGRTRSEPRRTAPAGAVRAGTLLARRGAVAQLVERNNRTVEARGSIPLSST